MPLAAAADLLSLFKQELAKIPPGASDVEMSVAVRTAGLGRSSARRPLRILHISDLHERAFFADMPAHRAPQLQLDTEERGIVLGERFEDALLELRGAGIDLVCFTGDLADWAHEAEYDAATRRMARILEVLDVPRQRFFAVPGNHDVTRATNETKWREIRDWLGRAHDVSALGRWMRDAAGAPIGLEHSHKHRVLERTANFWTWLEGFGRPDLRPRGPCRLGYRSTIELGALPHVSMPVHIVGLDSAWLCGDDRDQGNIVVTDEQVLAHTRVEAHALDGIRIGLVHHPLDHLADHHSVRRLLGDNGVDVLLHGHQHDPMAQIQEEPGASLRIVAAGCLMEGELGRNWPNGFSLIELDLDTKALEIHFRKWSKRGNFWSKQTDLYRAAQDGVLRLASPGRAALSTETGPSESALRARGLKAMNEPLPVAPIDVLSYATRCRERWGHLTQWPSHASRRGEPVSLLDRFVPQRCSEDSEQQSKEPAAWRIGERSSRQSKPHRREQDVLQRIVEAERLVILGHAGSGKSALLRYVLLSVLDGCSSSPRDWRAALSGHLPILAELRDYADSDGSSTLLDAIADVHARQGFTDTAASLRSTLSSSPTLLLIDGLDEIVNARLRRSLTQEAIGFATRFPMCRVIVTSRTFGFEDEPFRAARFAIVRLLEFNDAEVAKFTESCSRPDLFRELQRRPELLTIARTPLVLSLIEALMDAEGPGKTRADIYEQLLKTLAFEWDDDRGITALLKQGAPPGSLLPDFVPRDHTVSILMRMACEMETQSTGSAELSDEGLRRLLRTYSEQCDIRGLKAQRTAYELRELLIARTGVLRVSPQGTWRFAHRTVLDYLVARVAAARMRDGTLTAREFVREYGLRMDRMGDANEVVQLACALLPATLAEEVLLALCASPDIEQRGESADAAGAVGPNLVLAWQALAEMSIDRLDELRGVPARMMALLSHVRSMLPGTRPDLLDSAARRLPGGRWLDAVGLAGLDHPVHSWFDSFWRELLGKFPEDSNFARAVLLRAATSKWRERERLAGSALAAFASRGCAAAFDALRTLAASDSHPRVRARAVEALCFASDREKSFDAVRRAVETDPDALVRSKACWTLSIGYADHRETEALLRDRAVRDADFIVRYDAVEQLALAYGGDPSVTTFLRRRAEADEPLRQVASLAAETSLTKDSVRQELHRSFRAASASESRSTSAVPALWSIACEIFEQEETMLRDATFAEMHLRGSHSFERAWTTVSRHVGELETVAETAESHRREAGAVIALAALVAATATGAQSSQREQLSQLRRQLSKLGVRTWASDLIFALLHDFPGDFEHLCPRACARDVDLALGPKGALLFVSALHRIFGPSPSLALVCHAMEIDIEDLKN